MLLVWGLYRGEKVLCAVRMSTYCCVNIVRECRASGQLVLTGTATYTLDSRQLDRLFAGRPVPAELFDHQFNIEPVAEGFDVLSWLREQDAAERAGISMHSASL
jgi:hypothetical protein